MINITDKKDCCGCYACYNICSTKCIDMQSDEEGFWYPVVQLDHCIDCGLCNKVCPIINQEIVNNKPVAYACINKDETIRRMSSSGGVFTMIAERVIASDGVIFGAGFDGKRNVVHSWVDNIEGISGFRGSKYVQSSIGDTYTQAKEFLEQGRKVLFSGTPCQIGGLKTFLGKEYDNLLCIDIVCHGVPSPKVFAKYCAELEGRFGASIRTIAFRNKDYGWKKFSLALSFDKEEQYRETLTKDLFMKGFLQDLYLRPSCYNCSFKRLNRQSDITLADFWGIGNILPRFDDDKGTSLVLIHSQKGETISTYLAGKTKYEQVDINRAISYNLAAVKAVDYNPKRGKFFQEIQENKDICRLIDKYTRPSFSSLMYLKIRSMLGNIKRRLSTESI